MKANMAEAAAHTQRRGSHPAQFPARWLAAVGIGGSWMAVALAETLLGNGQDALDDVGMIAENHTLIAGAGLLHWAAGMLLVVALAGLAPLAWAGRLARIGWLLTVTIAVGFGSFAMVHLIALETAAAGLDAAAMNQFLIQRLGDGAGPWTVPILFVALLGPWSFLMLLLGLVRLRLVSWLAPAIFTAGALVHMLVSAEMFETMSLWTMAAGATLAAIGILRSTTVRPEEDSTAR